MLAMATGQRLYVCSLYVFTHASEGAENTKVTYPLVRYVLEHKISDLRRQMSPKDELVSELRAQVADMEAELNAVTRTQAELQMQAQVR